MRGPGPERTAATQVAKAALAAVLAWLLTSSVLHLPQPFLAPYAAVFLVESTVHRSLYSAAQQVGAVLLGVLLSAGIEPLLPSTAAAVGVVVVVGMSVGRWRGWGSSGIWVGVTALLVLTMGSASQSMMLIDRVLEVTIGAAIGFGVNALVFPPTYVRNPADAVRAVAGDMSALLRDIAAALRGEGAADQWRGWVSRAGTIDDALRQAEEATEWTQESARWNVRHRRATAAAAASDRRSVLAIARSVMPPIREVAAAVSGAAEERAPFRYPGPDARRELARLLEAISEAADIRLGAGEFDGQLQAVTDTGRAAMTAVHRQVHDTPQQELELTAGLVAMLRPAQQAFDMLTS